MTEPLNPGWWLLFFTALLSVWNAGIIWFTHIAVYPLWPLVDAASFQHYHLPGGVECGQHSARSRLCSCAR
jgi:hypothetical protein